MHHILPNLYQRQIQPLEREDPAKSGHSKVLIFLVDLIQQTLSATGLAPQKREWVVDAV